MKGTTYKKTKKKEQAQTAHLEAMPISLKRIPRQSLTHEGML